MSVTNDALFLFLAALTAIIGCALLALSQSRNWREVIGGKPPELTPRLAKWTGWIFIFASLVFCVLRDGGSFAAILWPLLFAVGALSVAMLLAYRPSCLKPVSAILAKAAAYESRLRAQELSRPGNKQG
ncbi:MAG: DUF3325 domain-containing protein [Pseudomonadota bacterium]